ncbi:MAG TPA: hypothetical protein VLD37_03910 [Candidatus Bilamarchaeum sp.]|nr:hypothetical protein [Candidatus Bilamarchaeum sp.]
MPVAQFKVKKLNGVTQIKLADDAKLQAEFRSAFPNYEPLFSEASRAPPFDELKKHPKLREFIEAQFVAGRTFSFQLEIRAERDNIISKDVVLVDQSRKVCAISRWTPGEGITFIITN